MDPRSWKSIARLAEKYGYIEVDIPTPGFEPVVPGTPFSPY
jgi:hypothetical protein